VVVEFTDRRISQVRKCVNQRKPGLAFLSEKTVFSLFLLERKPGLGFLSSGLEGFLLAGWARWFPAFFGVVIAIEAETVGSAFQIFGGFLRSEF
jgi:hypothetical protein